MNYTVFFCSRLAAVFDTVTRLIIESAWESDYTVHTFAYRFFAPFSSHSLEMRLIGSARKEPLRAVMDFDDIYTGEKPAMYLSPSVLEVPLMAGGHYWGVAGSLFKLIPDLTTAYFTSWLLDKNMNSELALYKQYSMASLPHPLQEIAANYK